MPAPGRAHLPTLFVAFFWLLIMSPSIVVLTDFFAVPNRGLAYAARLAGPLLLPAEN